MFNEHTDHYTTVIDIELAGSGLKSHIKKKMKAQEFHQIAFWGSGGV